MNLNPHPTWPEDIPKTLRIPLSCGHRSFVTVRSGTWSDLLSLAPVRTKGLVLILPLEGEIRMGTALGCPKSKKDPVILLPCDHILSEISDVRTNRGTFLWFFFNDSVLAQAQETSLEFIEKFHQVFVAPLGEFIIIKNIFFPSGTLNRLETSLIPILRACMASCHPRLLKLFMERVGVPRARIELYLDRLVLKPRKDHRVALEAYPGGISALRRDMARLYMPSIPRLITERRMLLLKTWRSADASQAEILHAFQIASLGRIENSAPVPMYRGDLAQSRRAHKAATAKVSKEFREIPGLDLTDVKFGEEYLWDNAESEESGSDGIDFSDSGLFEIISKKALSTIPGFKGWEKLIKAA